MDLAGCTALRLGPREPNEELVEHEPDPYIPLRRARRPLLSARLPHLASTLRVLDLLPPWDVHPHEGHHVFATTRRALPSVSAPPPFFQGTPLFLFSGAPHLARTRGAHAAPSRCSSACAD